jgi:hypothetical protein
MPSRVGPPCSERGASVGAVGSFTESPLQNQAVPPRRGGICLSVIGSHSWWNCKVEWKPDSMPVYFVFWLIRCLKEPVGMKVRLGEPRQALCLLP